MLKLQIWFCWWYYETTLCKYRILRSQMGGSLSFITFSWFFHLNYNLHFYHFFYIGDRNWWPNPTFTPRTDFCSSVRGENILECWDEMCTFWLLISTKSEIFHVKGGGHFCAPVKKSFAEYTTSSISFSSFVS